MKIFDKLLVAAFALLCVPDHATAGEYYLDYDQSLVDVCLRQAGSSGAITRPVMDCLEQRSGRVVKTQAVSKPRYIPVLEQRTAVLTCKRKLGLRGQTQFNGTWSEIPLGGQAWVGIAPSRTVSVAQAEWINNCAAEKLGLSYEAMPIPVRNKAVGTCYKGAPPIVGGSTYCPRKR